METWDAIRARRNVRQYAQQPIARPDRRLFDEVVHGDR
jgi:hypothetical protein